MKRSLICNADDIGFSKGVTNGILRAHREGVVSSTTLMANMPAAQYAASALQQHPGLGVGLHLVLSIGPPVSHHDAIPHLVDPERQFRSLQEQAKNLRFGTTAIAREVETEWDAQIRRAGELGFRISHCDSHHGLHKYPLCRNVLISLLKRHKIPCVRAGIRYGWPVRKQPRRLADRVRKLPAILVNALNERAYRANGIRFVDQYLNVGAFAHAEPWTPSHLAEAIAELPPGVTELAFHPGLPDAEDTFDRPEYGHVRERDLMLLTAPLVRQAIEESNISLISYRDLASAGSSA